MTVERSESPYLQVARQIRDEIESGSIPVGAHVPSARQISARWGVSIATATKSHAHLRSLGLVAAIPGRGTVVVAREVGSAKDKLAAALDGDVYGGLAESKILSSELVPAPDYVASALDVDPGAPVVRRERITYQREIPIRTSVSWLPYSPQAPALLSTDRVPQGCFQYLASAIGARVGRSRQMLAADTATAEQRARLNLDPGAPVLLAREWYLSDTGQVLEYDEDVNAPRQWVTSEF